jgi:C-terminal processing protease CtpA/Prc
MKRNSIFVSSIAPPSRVLAIGLLLISGAVQSVRPQLVGGQKSSPETFRQLDMGEQRKRGREMLDRIKRDLEEHYFDPRFRGIDLDAHFRKAEEQINNAVSGDQIYGIIASALLTFEDSHTFFIPPIWSFDVDYGWGMQMIGDNCYVVWVEPGSDAAKQGLKPGDAVLALFDIHPTRDNLHQIEYLFYGLRPVRALQVVVQSPGGKPRQLDLLTKIRQATWGSVAEVRERQSYSYQYYIDVGDDLFIWKMPEFNLNDKGLEEMMAKVRKRKALILDLRDNGGGYEITLQHLVGYFFDHDVKIGERKGRKESKPVMAKTQGDKAFKGQLVVIVDSRSASAAELFARVMQLEKRGTVIGDRTAGAVTEARRMSHDYKMKGMLPVTYGLSVTVNEFIMPDGKGLERVGVIPDEVILPKALDLASQLDPVLLRAAQICGVKLELKKHIRRDVPSSPDKTEQPLNLFSTQARTPMPALDVPQRRMLPVRSR